MTDEQRIAIARADAAKRIMGDTMVKDALAAIEDGIVSVWKDLPHQAVAERENLHRLLQTKRQFERLFEAHIQNGAFATNDLRIEEERKTLAQRFKDKIYG